MTSRDGGEDLVCQVWVGVAHLGALTCERLEDLGRRDA